MIYFCVKRRRECKTNNNYMQILDASIVYREKVCKTIEIARKTSILQCKILEENYKRKQEEEQHATLDVNRTRLILELK